MRNDPIYYDIQPSNSSEHVNTFSMPRSAGIMGTLRDYMPRGTDFSVVWPHSGARFLSLGYVVPPSRGLARQLGLGIMALDPLWGKFIIINQGVAALDFTSTLARLINTGEDYGEVFTRIPGVFVISSDFTAGKDGTTGKIIAVTDSSDEEFTTSISGRDLIVRAGKGEAVISHSYRNDRRINIIVGEDIDATDPEQVQWAVSTRVNPHTDVEISRNSIVIRADRVTPEVPALDKSAVERIRRLFPDSEASGS
jgi:3-polyprenyl-4-hydroxybenzoate decarboxylase